LSGVCTSTVEAKENDSARTERRERIFLNKGCPFIFPKAKAHFILQTRKGFETISADEEKNAALFFAGHFCADADFYFFVRGCTKKAERDPLFTGDVACEKLAREAGACCPWGGFSRRG